MKVLNFDNYTFRCSGLGNITTGVGEDPLTPIQRAKMVDYAGRIETGAKITDNQKEELAKFQAMLVNKDLPKGVITYLQKLHRDTIFSRSKQVGTKYTEKGLVTEEDSLTLYSILSNQLLVKNEKFYRNEFIQGTPDNTQGIIRDIKSSYDFSTFPFYDKECPNSDYDWQLQGYMELVDLERAELVYCLNDTPVKIINDELRRLDWKLDIFDSSGLVRPNKVEIVVETVSNLIYTKEGLIDFCNDSPSVKIDWFSDFHEVPAEMRVKVFEFERDRKRIELLNERIELCREALNNMTIEVYEMAETNAKAV